MHRRHFLLVIANIGHAESFSPSSSRRRWSCHHTTSKNIILPSPTLLGVIPPNRPRESNWEDDTKSSRTNADVTDYVPPWRDHQSSTTNNKSGVSVGNMNSNTVLKNNDMPFRAVFATKQKYDTMSSSEGGGSSSSITNSGILLHNIKWPLIRDPPGVSTDYPLLQTRIIITILSTIATWYIHVHNSHSPILASSSCALLVSTCLDRRLGQAALCGSFAGMCNVHLVPNLYLATVLGILTSICYEILIHVNNLCLGIGGRLGVTAFLATSVLAKYNGVHIVTTARRGLRRGSVLLRKSGGSSAIGNTSGSLLGDPILLSMIGFHILGAVATIVLRESSDDSAAADPVRASSVVGLLGSLILKDPMAVLGVYGGSFVGMSLPSRLIHGHGNSPSGQQRQQEQQTPLSLFGSFAGAGALAGVFHALTIRHGYWNGGWGGKAGLCAFVGCWTYRGLANTIDFMKSKTRRK